MVKITSVISIVLWLVLIVGYAQGITTYFGPVYVRVGDDFTIRCSTNHFRFPKWSINGRNLEEGSAIQIIQPKENGRQEAILRVFHAGLQHAGAYSCDLFDSDKHHVYVVDTESVNETQRCFLIKPETSLALTCEPESMAPFFWYYGKDEARYLPKGHVELRTAQLLFHGVQLSDAGRYICRSAKNSSMETTYHLVTPILTKREPNWIKVARIGSSVALDCDFTAEPQPHIEWFIGSDHAELTKRAHHRVHISMNPITGVPNSRLIVQNIDSSDNNDYTCRASHLMCGIQTEQVVKLRAQRFVIVGLSGEHSTRDNIFVDHLGQPSNTMAPGDTFSIRCVTPWHDMVNAWKKDDVVIPSGSRFGMTSVRLKSQEAKNLLNVSRISAKQLTNRAQSSQTEVDTAAFEDAFTSSASAIAHGRRGKRGEVWQASRDDIRHTVLPLEDKLKALAKQKLEVWTLKIDKVELSDSGNYSCGGEAETYFSLKVENSKAERSGKLLPESEILTNVEQTEYGTEGVIVNPKSQKLVLKCNYTGERHRNEAVASYTYRWYKNHSLIEESSKYHIESEGPASTLTIDGCDVLDAGNYTCKLNDEEEATLSVYMYPTLEHVEKYKNQVQGDPLTLLCKARGAPVPKVTWYKDEMQLVPDERIELSEIDGVVNAKLIIKDLQYEDKGKYLCKAMSANVTRSVEIAVLVKDKYAALWPFLGICAEVAILCTIIFIYEKRRTKPEFEDDDEKKDTPSRK